MCSSAKSITLKPPTPLPVGSNLNNKQFHQTFRQSNDNVERLQQQRIHQFEASEPAFQQQITIDHIRCPSHLIQFKQAINTLENNQTLKIQSHSAALINDLAASARILKLDARTLRFRRRHFLYVTQTAE